MKTLPNLLLAAAAVLSFSHEANAQSRAQYEGMVAAHASAVGYTVARKVVNPVRHSS